MASHIKKVGKKTPLSLQELACQWKLNLFQMFNFIGRMGKGGKKRKGGIMLHI